MADELFLKKGYARLVEDLLSELANPSGGVPLTDATEGSVVRTLVESFARELAVAYEQVAAVHRQGYLETASGAGLDMVVALVGLQRRVGGYAEGTLLFSRTEAATADVMIPQGTRVAGTSQDPKKPIPPVETTADAVLLAGDRSVAVRARSVAPVSEAIPAAALSFLPRPVFGVESVSNPGVLTVRTSPETDEELRSRARFVLRRRQAGTVEGIELAARSFGVRQLSITEQRGQVDVLVGDTDFPEVLLPELRDVIEELRPAGIRLTVERAIPVPLVVNATVVLARVPKDDDEIRIRSELEGRLQQYLEGLSVDEAVLYEKLRGALLGHEAVAELGRDASNALLLKMTPQRLDVSINSAGDLPLSGGKRVQVERIEVTLRRPEEAVRVEVMGILKKGTTSLPEVVEQTHKDRLTTWFAEEFEANGSRARGIDWNGLVARIPVDMLSSIRFRLTREEDGSSLELVDASTPAVTLLARDRLTLRTVEIQGG